MTPLIRTERLTLRPLRSTDAAALVHHLADWSVMRWLSAPPWPYTLTDAEDFIPRVSGAQDLGYWLAKEKHGNGLMSEAVTAVLLDHFSVSTQPVISGHMPGNEASRSVLLKHGFADTHVEQL